MLDFALDPFGSNLVQNKLPAASDSEKEALFAELAPSLPSLFTHPQASAVIKRLFEVGTAHVKQQLLSGMSGRVLELSQHPQGCRIVQNALGGLDAAGRCRIAEELAGHAEELIRDQNGNHVIQKAVEMLRGNAINFVLDVLRRAPVDYCSHVYGCRVVQRVLESCPREQVPWLLAAIHASTRELTFQQYGNYVVQHVLQNGHPRDRAQIVKFLRQSLVECGQHKFASNVLERALEKAGDEAVSVLVRAGTRADDTGVTPVFTLMRDQFGNFVVQKMLDMATEPERKGLLELLMRNVPTLKRYAYGKHILTRLSKLGYNIV